MSLEEYDYLKVDGYRTVDFKSLEKGTIVAIQVEDVMGLDPSDDEADFEAIPENPNIHYVYNLRFEFEHLLPEEPMSLLVEVIDEHTAREVVTGEEFLIGDEDTYEYIEKPLHNPNITEEEEIQIFNKCRQKPFVIRPEIIVDKLDETTKQKVLSEFDVDEFSQFISRVKEETRSYFDTRFQKLLDYKKKEQDKMMSDINFDNQIIEMNYNQSVVK